MTVFGKAAALFVTLKWLNECGLIELYSCELQRRAPYAQYFNMRVKIVAHDRVLRNLQDTIAQKV